jgi:hypothetical protein
MFDPVNSQYMHVDQMSFVQMVFEQKTRNQKIRLSQAQNQFQNLPIKLFTFTR